MSINLYDDALVGKLSRWTKNTDLTVLSPEDSSRLIGIIADKNNDKPLKLPIISLSRPNGFTRLTNQNNLISKRGIRLEVSPTNTKNLRVIPISIKYQVDVYARYKEEAEEYIRNLVFNFINFPKMDIVIPYYDTNYTHTATIAMDDNIEDTSDIPTRLIAGQFTRMTIYLTIDNAYLFDIKYNDTWRICPDCVDVEVSE